VKVAKDAASQAVMAIDLRRHACCREDARILRDFMNRPG
jgi:hypothetical protein